MVPDHVCIVQVNFTEDSFHEVSFDEVCFTQGCQAGA